MCACNEEAVCATLLVYLLSRGFIRGTRGYLKKTSREREKKKERKRKKAKKTVREKEKAKPVRFTPGADYDHAGADKTA